MNSKVELRVVRFTDGTIDVEGCEFDDHGKIIQTLPWDQCWFCAFLGGFKGELADWLKQQLINAFTAGYLGSLNAGWMAESTMMAKKEPRCNEHLLPL